MDFRSSKRRFPPFFLASGAFLTMVKEGHFSNFTNRGIEFLEHQVLKERTESLFNTALRGLERYRVHVSRVSRCSREYNVWTRFLWSGSIDTGRFARWRCIRPCLDYFLTFELSERKKVGCTWSSTLQRNFSHESHE